MRHLLVEGLIVSRPLALAHPQRVRVHDHRRLGPVQILKLHNGRPGAHDQLLVTEIRVHAFQLHLDGHGVDGTGHDATIAGARQHALQHGPKRVDVLDADIGLDQALLLVLVLFPGRLPFVLSQVFINLNRMIFSILK